MLLFSEEEVDGHLKMLEKDSEKIRAEFQKMVALTNSRRQVLKEKNMKLEAMIEVRKLLTLIALATYLPIGVKKIIKN